jgi:hypothetical protein
LCLNQETSTGALALYYVHVRLNRFRFLIEHEITQDAEKAPE